ncbi:hypothetical protein ACFL2T_01140 [Elusimicrobiota bacterium]
MKYGIRWWQTRFYWWAHEFVGYLMSPCWPMRATDWIDTKILRRRFLMEAYDTWTMRLSTIFYGRWAKLCYGPDRRT